MQTTITTLESERILDQEHLRLLRIGYLISGGVSAFAGGFGLLYAVIGGFIMAASPFGGRGPNGPPPAFIGAIFGAVGLAIVIFCALTATLKFLAARALRQRRARVLCFVAAALSCLSIPYGTALGIFTFAVLSRPSVQRLFTTGDELPPPHF
jgi:hypothetical protein